MVGGRFGGFLRFGSFCVALGFGSAFLSAETPNVDDLSRELRSLKAERRAEAAETLGKMGPRAAPAVRSLVAALSDQSMAVQLESLLALEHIGPAAREAVPGLVRVLEKNEKNNEKLYIGAIAALGAIGRDSQEAAPALTRFLKGNDPVLSAAAGLALARILPEESEELKTAIPILVRSLKSPQLAVRHEAALALGNIGRPAVEPLVEVVKAESKDWETASLAASALEMMGPLAERAVPALTEALRSRHEKVILHAADALAAIGPAARTALPALRKLLTGQQVALRLHAANAIGDIGQVDEEAVGDLTNALKDKDENVRRESAEALGKIGPAAASASPALVELLGDDAGSVAVHAAWSLGRIGPAAVLHLIAALKTPEKHLAIMVLGDIGPAAKAAAAPLAELLSEKDLDRDLGREIMLALAHMGPDARPAIPALMKILKHEEHPLRPGAAWALARIGAKQANEELIKALPKQDDPRMQIVAPIALMVLNPDTDVYLQFALPRLRELLNHEALPIRREAAMVLAELGPKAAPAVPELTQGLQDPDPEIRKQFLTALAAIGPDSAEALPSIMQALADQDPTVRSTAVYAIGRIGKDAQQAIPFLEKNLREHDEFLRFASAWALMHVSAQPTTIAAQCLEPLIHGLKLPNPRGREEAAQALGMMGSAARSAVPALEAIANDPDENVKKSVAAALRAIGR
jgi:HEAT repeat protein